MNRYDYGVTIINLENMLDVTGGLAKLIRLPTGGKISTFSLVQLCF